MSKFRKKPVVIEAIQYTGYNVAEIMPWSDAEIIRELPVQAGRNTVAVMGQRLTIQTLEGEMIANVNDWIIKGVKGELYPCKPDIFEMTYEPVSQEEPNEK